MGDLRPFGLGVPGGTDHQCLGLLRATICQRGRDRVHTKVDHHLGRVHGRRQIVSGVHGRHQFHLGCGVGCCEQGAAHAPAASHNGHACHRFFNTPDCWSVARSRARVASAIGTKGSLSSSWISPVMASAALIGAGLVSRNRSRKTG